MTISKTQIEEGIEFEETKKIYCSYCGSKLTSEDSSCFFCGTFSAKVGLQELAENLLSTRKAVKTYKKELAAKKQEIKIAEHENLRRVALRSPFPPEDLIDLNNEKVSIEASLEAEKKCYFALDELARSTYPQIFKRQKK